MGRVKKHHRRGKECDRKRKVKRRQEAARRKHVRCVYGPRTALWRVPKRDLGSN